MVLGRPREGRTRLCSILPNALQRLLSPGHLSLSPRPLESVPSEQITTPDDLLSHLPGPWMIEGLALFLTVSCMCPLALSLLYLQKLGKPVPGAWPTADRFKV